MPLSIRVGCETGQWSHADEWYRLHEFRLLLVARRTQIPDRFHRESHDERPYSGRKWGCAFVKELGRLGSVPARAVSNKHEIRHKIEKGVSTPIYPRVICFIQYADNMSEPLYGLRHILRCGSLQNFTP